MANSNPAQSTSTNNPFASFAPIPQQPAQVAPAVDTSGVDTAHSLTQQYEEQPLTPQEQQLNNDWYNLTPAAFTQKYGTDVFNSMAQQYAAQDQTIADAYTAQAKTELESIGDAAKNFVGGGLSAITGTLAGVTSPIRPVSKAFAYLTEGIDNAMQNMASDAELAEQRMYARQMEAVQRRLDREEAEDIAKGKSPTEANLARLGKEFMADWGASWDTGHISQVVGQGLGSTAASLGIAKGLSLAAGAANLGARLGATKAGQLLANATPAWASKLVGRAAPWSTAEMMMEGGGQYSQQLIKGLQTDFDTLEKNSPEFRRLYKVYKDQGLSDMEAKEHAREDVSFAGARESGALTAATVAPLAVLSAGIARPFTSGGRPFRAILGDSLAEFAVSEPGQEASGQFFGNLATQRYLDKNQRLSEGVGQAAAQGSQGAMGISGIHIGTAGLVPGSKAAAKGIGKAVNAATGGLLSKITGKFGSNEEEGAEDTGSDETGEKTLSTTTLNDLSEKTVSNWSAGIKAAIDNAPGLSEIQKKQYKEKASEIIGRHVVTDEDFAGLSPAIQDKLKATEETITDSEGNQHTFRRLNKQISTLMDVVDDEKMSTEDRGAAAETILKMAQKFSLSPQDVEHLDNIAKAAGEGEFAEGVKVYKDRLKRVSEAFQKPVVRQRIQKAADQYLASRGGVEGVLNKTIANINGSLDSSDKFVEKIGKRKFAPTEIDEHTIKVSRGINDANGSLDITASIDNISATVNVPNGSSNSEIYKKLLEANDKLKGKLRLDDIPDAKKTVQGSGMSPRDTMGTVLFAMANASNSGINGKNFDNVSKQLQQIASAPNGSNVSTRDKHLAAILLTNLNTYRDAMDSLPEEKKDTGIEQVARNIFVNKAEDPDEEAPRIKGKSFYEHFQDFLAAYTVGDLDAAIKAWNRSVRLASHLKNKALAQDAAYVSSKVKKVKDKKTGKKITVAAEVKEGDVSRAQQFVGIAMDNGAAITSSTKFKHTVKGREYTQALIKQAKVAQDLINNLSSLKGVIKTLEAGASKGNVLYKKGVQLTGEEAKLVSIFDPIKYSKEFTAYMEAAPKPEGGGLGLKLKENKFTSPLTEAEESLVYTDYSKFSKEEREAAFKKAFEFEESNKEKVDADILKKRLDISRYEFLHQFDNLKASLGSDKSLRAKMEKLVHNRQAFATEIEKKMPGMARYLRNAPDSIYQKISQYLLDDSFEDKFGKAFDSLITKAQEDINEPTDAVYKESKIGLVALGDDAKNISPIVKEIVTIATKQAMISASNRQSISDKDRVQENWFVDLGKYYSKGKTNKQYMEQFEALRQGTDIVNFVNSIISNIERYAELKYSQDIPVHFTKGVTASLAYAAARALADAGYINITNVELINKAENNHKFEEDILADKKKNKQKAELTDKEHNAKVDIVWFNKKQKTLGDTAKKLNIQDIYDVMYGKDHEPDLEIAFTEEFRKQYNAQLQQNNPSQPANDWFDLNGLENKPENAATSDRDITAQEMRKQGITETVVGGASRGSKYPEGIYTLPGTHPDTWNGQKLSSIRDPEGGKILGKFYSETGSEYIYSENGYSRRVKFWDNKHDVQGKDAGVGNWARMYFIPTSSSFRGNVLSNFFEQYLHDLNFKYVTFQKDGLINFYNRDTKAWEPLTVRKTLKYLAHGTGRIEEDSEVDKALKSVFAQAAIKAFNGADTPIRLSTKPGLGMAALEIFKDSRGNYSYSRHHPSSGPHYFETGSTISSGTGKAKEPLKQADMVTWAEAGGQTLYKVHTKDPFDKVQYKVLQNRVKKEYKYNWSSILQNLNSLEKNPDGTFKRDADGNLDVTKIAAKYGIILDPTDNKMLRESKEGKILPIREAMETILSNIEASINLLASEGFIPAETTVYDVLKSPDLQAQLSKTAAHFNTSFANTNREQQLHGVNPLGNKYYRESLLNTEATYDLTSNIVNKKEQNKNLLYFKAACLQCVFGEKIQDYPTLQDAADEWDDIVKDGKTGTFNKTIRAYFAKTDRTLEDEKKFFNYLTDDCGIKPGDITPMLYHALQEWIRYEDTLKSGGRNLLTGEDLSNWTSNLYLDLDGQCNGSAMKQMYEANGTFDVDAIKYMNAVGFALGSLRTAAELRQDSSVKAFGPSAKIHKSRKKNTPRSFKTTVDTYTNGGKDGLASIIDAFKSMKNAAKTSETAAQELAYWRLVYQMVLQDQVSDPDKKHPDFEELSDDGATANNYSFIRAWLKKQIQAEKYNGTEQAIAGRIVSMFKDDLGSKFSTYNRAFLDIKNLIKARNAEVDKEIAQNKQPTKTKFSIAYSKKNSLNQTPWGYVTPGTQYNPGITVYLGHQDLNAIAYYCVKNKIDKYENVLERYCSGDKDFYNFVRKDYIAYTATLRLLTEKVNFFDEEEKAANIDRVLGILETLNNNYDKNGYIAAPVIKHKEAVLITDKKTKKKKRLKDKKVVKDFVLKSIHFDEFEFTSEEEDNLKNNLASTVGKPLYQGYTKSSRHSRQTTDFKIATSTIFAVLKKMYIHWRATQLARESKAVFIKGTDYPKFGYTPAQLKQAKKEADALFPQAKVGSGDDAMHISFFNTTEKVKNGGLAVHNLVSKSGSKSNVIYLGDRDIAMPGVSFDPRSVFAFGDTGSFANWIMYLDSLPIYDGSTAPPNNIERLSEFAATTINNKVLTPQLGTAFWLADAWEKNYNAMKQVNPDFLNYVTNKVKNAIKDKEELKSSNFVNGEEDTELNDFYELNRALRTLHAAIQGKTVDELTEPITDKTFLLDTFGDDQSPYSINPAEKDSDGNIRTNLWSQTLDALKELKIQRIAHVRAIKRFGLSSEHIAGAHRPILTIEDENGVTHNYTEDDVPDKYKNKPISSKEFITPEQQVAELNRLYEEEYNRLKEPLSTAAQQQSEIILNKDNLNTVAHWFRTNAANRQLQDVRLFNTVKILLTGTGLNGSQVTPLLSNAKIKFYHDKNKMKSDYYLSHPNAPVMPDAVEAFYDVKDHAIYISLPHKTERAGFMDDRTKILIVHEMIHAATTRALYLHRQGLGDKKLNAAVQQLEISMRSFLDIFNDDLLKYQGIANSLSGKKNLTDAEKAALKMHKQLQEAKKKVDVLQDYLSQGKVHEAMAEYMAYAMTTPAIWKLLRKQGKGAIYASINQMHKNNPAEAHRLTSFLDQVTNTIKKALDIIGSLLGLSGPRAQWIAELGLPNTANDTFTNAELLETALFNIAEFNEAHITDSTGKDLGWNVDGLLFSMNTNSQEISSPAAQNFVGSFLSKVLPSVDVSSIPTEDMDAIANGTTLASASFGLSNTDTDALNLAAACIKNSKAFSSNLYAQLSRIYLNAQSNLKADMFDSNGEDKLKALFNPDLPADIKVPVFCAIAITSPEVQIALKKVPKTKYAKATGGVALDRFLMDSGNILIDNLQRSLSGTKGTNANAELNSTVNFASKHMNAKEQVRQRGAFMKALDIANNAIVTTTGKVLDKIAPGTKGIRKAGHITILELMNRVKMPEWLRRIILDILPSDTRKAAANIYNMLGKAKTEIDQLRQRTLEVMPQALKELFKTPITKEQDTALYNSIIRTDLAGVLEFDEAKKYIKDAQARKSRIAQLRSAISLPGYKFDAADNLAEYLATGKFNKKATMTPVHMNAFDIYYMGSGLIEKTERKAYTKSLKAGNVPTIDPNVQLLDEYISLKALDQVDNSQVIQMLETEETGIRGIFNAQKKVLEMEFVANADTLGWGNRLNAIKGYSPMTQGTEASLVWSVEDLSNQGYVRTPENKNIWYAPFGSNSKFNEGIVRHTQQTFRGSVLGRGANRNGFAFISNDHPKEAWAQVELLTKQGIPVRNVYSRNGKFLGYEVILPQDMVDKYLRPEFEATNQVAKYYGRILEENKAEELSLEAIDMCWENFANASGANVSKREYVNAYELAKTDKHVAEALEMLPGKYHKYIREKFGGTEENPVFWIPRNQIYEVLGVREFSVIDIFTGKTNISPTTQRRLQNIAHWIMGKKAAYYLRYGEALAQKGVNFAKNTILVRSISVGEGNLVSNFLQCLSYGMTLPQIFRAYRRIQGEVETYIKNILEIQKCEAQQLAYEKGSPRWNALQNTIDALTSANNELDIKELVDWGHLNTIEDMGIAPDDIKLLSGKWAEYHENVINNSPEILQTAEKYALITKNSAAYTALNKMLIYGDFIAKQILKEHLEQEGKMTKEEIQNEVRDAFVDYNRSAGRVRNYLENMGLLWFWNYKLRMVRVMTKLAIKNPLFLLLATAAPAYMGINSLLTDNFVGNLFNGKLANSIGPGMFFHSFSMNPWISVA